MNGACFCIGAQGHPSGLCPCQRRQQDWKRVSDDIFKPIHKEAADAIERLSARIAALESVLNTRTVCAWKRGVYIIGLPEHVEQGDIPLFELPHLSMLTASAQEAQKGKT